MAAQLHPSCCAHYPHHLFPEQGVKDGELLPQLPSAYTAPSACQLGGCVVLFLHFLLRPGTNVSAL